MYVQTKHTTGSQAQKGETPSLVSSFLSLDHLRRTRRKTTGMPHSHHSHSGQFCRHAKDSLEQVIQEAVRQKFKVFGLSEHAPRYRLQDLFPEEVGLFSYRIILTYSPTYHPRTSSRLISTFFIPPQSSNRSIKIRSHSLSVWKRITSRQ